MLDRVIEFLSRQRYAVVSTVGAFGAPESALVGIAWWRPLAGLPELMFDTISSSRKAKNIARDPRCSLVLGWEDETTIQLEGDGRRVEGTELQRAKLDYFDIWPQCRAHESWSDVAYFSIRPRWLRYSCYLGEAVIREFDEQQLVSGLPDHGVGLFSRSRAPKR